MNLSKTRIDRLGQRLRAGSPTESDLRLLDDYRRSFDEAYQIVVRTVRERLRTEPTGRPAKSTGSIIEKLRRETMRLSQMQDIAGCRVVVGDAPAQNQAVELLREAFPTATIVDRRAQPSYGYRAVHVVADVSGKPVEIQVRSLLQHAWAELSEICADEVDPDVKYGGGPEYIKEMLAISTEMVARYERIEGQVAGHPRAADVEGELRKLKVELFKELIAGISLLED